MRIAGGRMAGSFSPRKRPTIQGARIQATATRTTAITKVTVTTTLNIRHASRFLPLCQSSLNAGMKAEESPPPAMSMKITSGIWTAML